MKQQFENVITTEEGLREVMGYPGELAARKVIDHVDENCRLFIEESPFIVIATSDKDGNLDASPKGDPAGFVKILDHKTLAIPDRLGNRRADTFSNIIQNPKVGLIFLIPGLKETLRINGDAQIVRDENVLSLLSHKNKLPNLAIIVHVQEAFLHCTKCMIRSNLWTTTETSSAKKVPTLTNSLLKHSKVDMTYEDLDKELKDDEKEGLY